LQYVSREKIIISTPNYEYVQNEARGNPYEKHVSLWNRKAFELQGYSIKGVGLQIQGKIFFSRIPLLRGLLARVVLPWKFAGFAELIVGIKDVRS